jgi:hypothetical protein
VALRTPYPIREARVPPEDREGPSRGSNGGVADSLDEAKAAFRVAWERPRPLSEERIDMLNPSL